MNKKENFLKGIIKENPLFVALLGMCPSLAVTTSLENAIGMSVAVFFVLVSSNFLVSLIMSNAKLAELVRPVRIPVYIVIIATLVTLVQMLMHAFIINLFYALGIFLPLIVVNCIILGRAEAFASENTPLDSVIDGAGMAAGYGLAIMLISFFREILGNGTLTVWGKIQVDFVPLLNFLHIQPISLFTQPAGAFLTFGILLGIITMVSSIQKNKKAKGVKANG